MARYVETCCVANQHCKSPANLTPPRAARATCYACGEHVCTARGCSLTTTAWPTAKGKRVRICSNCCEHEPEFARRIDADIYLESGYPEFASKVRSGESQPPWRKRWST